MKASLIQTDANVSPVVCIVGPTASGKSGLAMRIARKLESEIICADSQTIRRGLDIGTAKPTKAEQEEIPHHLLDIIDPYDRFTAAEFKELANLKIEDIKARHKLPILVGGTGLYVDAVVYDFSFRNTADLSKRKRLEEKTVEELQSEITQKQLAMPHNLKNKRHLIRTIESGGMIALNKTLRSDVVMIGLCPDQPTHAKRIADRVGQMLKDGFVDEVKHVVTLYGGPPAHWDALGYKIVLEQLHYDGKIDADRLKDALTAAHRQYAKRQKSWFKRNRDIIWFEEPLAAENYILKRLSNVD